ncbi:hypothetical protein [Azoarcus sp. KH32C]|uniref:hypothetical protein n=1 Tax=Azoarcus sp. KH32C TaxID=748247 RepID=UPI0002385FDF|nr:hypothetical protein [Azoarcus sp. KH32C]BAL24009.1 hypothetical protein AZKH_1694 [Azoarcus sp. KH32C]
MRLRLRLLLLAAVAAAFSLSALADSRVQTRDGRSCWINDRAVVYGCEPASNSGLAVDVQSGQVYTPVGPGYVGQDGRYYAPAGPSAIVDSRTGQVVSIAR